MFDAMERIAYLSNVAKEQKQLRFNKLYKTVQRKEFLEFAYEQIRGNKGSKTAGVDEITKDTYEESRVKEEHLIQLSKDLFDESYKPLPVRRVMIEKGHKRGYRPLGIPALKDRIVQSAVKIILEALYEPIFSENSHGFRPKRSCQTAIEQIVYRKTDWVIEGDIKGCFDNVKHGKLLDLLRKRIADERFINLINKFLKSGYQMGYGLDGKYPIHETKDGTPQGSIVSPILANIYLHEFDLFMDKKTKPMNLSQRPTSQEYIEYINRISKLGKALREGKTRYKLRVYTSEMKEENRTLQNKEEIEQHIEVLINKRSKYNTKDREYNYYNNHINRLRKALRENKIPYTLEARGLPHETKLENREEMVQAIKKLKKLRKQVPTYDSAKYFENKSFGYVRYADDFVILLGNYRKNDANELKEIVREWFTENLQLELSEEKTLITHSTDGFRFLGYDILKVKSEDGIGYGHFSKVYVPYEKIDKVKEKIQKLLKMYHIEPFDLIYHINSIINGWGNYYKICNNYSKVAGRLDHWLHWELSHWFGRKYKIQIPEVLRKYYTRVQLHGNNIKRFYARAEGKNVYLKKFSDIKYTTPSDVAQKIKTNREKERNSDKLDQIGMIFNLLNTGHSPKSFFELGSEEPKCAVCGAKNVTLHVHHKRMVKRDKNKSGRDIYNSSRELPKILLCTKCHREQHPTNQSNRG